MIHFIYPNMQKYEVLSQLSRCLHMQKRRHQIIFLSCRNLSKSSGVIKEGFKSREMQSCINNKLLNTTTRLLSGNCWFGNRIHHIPKKRHFMTSAYYLKGCESKSSLEQTQNLHEKLFERERSFQEAEHELIEKLKERKAQVIEDIKETKSQVKERVSEVVERENIWTIPNLLCVGRLVISPVIFHLILSGEYNTALGMFLLAGFTDLLDGWIARRWISQSSRIGSFLDPLADKVLVAFVFLSLTMNGLIPLALTGLIIYRDACIITGAFWVRYQSLPPPRTIIRYFDATHATAQLSPTTISKINTAVQLGLITASLAAPVFNFVDHTALHILWGVTAVTTLSSGISYIFSTTTYTFLKKMEKEK